MGYVSERYTQFRLYIARPFVQTFCDKMLCMCCGWQRYVTNYCYLPCENCTDKKKQNRGDSFTLIYCYLIWLRVRTAVITSIQHYSSEYISLDTVSVCLSVCPFAFLFLRDWRIYWLVLSVILMLVWNYIICLFVTYSRLSNFLAILTTAAVLQMFLFSRAPFKASESFNFSLTFSVCQRRADKKKTLRKIIEQLLYCVLISTVQLLSCCSTIFPRPAQWARSCVRCKASGGEQECPLRATGRWPASLKYVACSQTGAHGASFSPPTARKGCPTATHILRTISNHI
jgi:hypothetical protein